MNIKLYIQWGDMLPNGKILWHRKRLAKCFVRGFMQHIEALANHSYGALGTSVSIMDTAGANQTVRAAAAGIYFASYYFSSVALAADATYGIVVGTGNAAVTTSDHALQTPIAHGNAAGQLLYSAVTIVGTVTVPASNTLQVVRTFTNSSGGDITVNEVAWYCSSMEFGGAQKFFCLTRDLQTQLIVNGGSKIAVLSLVTTL